MAQEGVPSLRFDLSGIGDSAAAKSAVALETIIQEDVDAAIEQVREAWGIEEIVLLGLCSGARDAFDAALRRSEIVGIVSIDLMAEFRTWQYHVAHYGGRLLSWGSWRNTLNGSNDTLSRILGFVRGDPAPAEDGLLAATLGLRPETSRNQLRSELSEFLDRGGRALCVFSGGLEHNCNHASQFYEALPQFANEIRFSTVYFGEANHIFSNRQYQSELVRCIQAWTVEQFG